MLKRLADQENLDSGDRKLSELLSSAAPFEDDPFRKRRIWVRLERGFKLPVRSARFWVRPLVIGALLISGTAAAELGHRYVLHGSGFLGLVGAPSATSSSVAVSPRAVPQKSVPRAPLAAVDALAPVDAPVPSEPAKAAEPVPQEPIASTRSTPKGTRTRAEAGEDATRVVEAIQALRTERNPARAQGLLNDYLKSNPRGSLSGDALALSIEAASAQHDPRAAEYARRYLAAYPKGKYRELAKRALEAQR